MNSVLIVEDEKHLAEGLRFNLEAEGYRVNVVADGETALDLLTRSSDAYDVVVLDVMLPGIDGFTVAREMRQAGQFVPVLMLTARSHPEDVLRGFEAGADDYIAKPFELAILIARIRGLLRRREWLRSEGSISSQEQKSDRGNDIYSFDGKTIDFSTLEIRAKDQVIRLTLMEAELLRHLIRHTGKVVSRKTLLEEVWGLREDTDTRAIDNFIARLRKLIEDEPSRPRRLLTVRGVGYRFVADTQDKTD
jgi:DNA-binding response OmpR family regulator